MHLAIILFLTQIRKKLPTQNFTAVLDKNLKIGAMFRKTLHRVISVFLSQDALLHFFIIYYALLVSTFIRCKIVILYKNFEHQTF